MNKLLLDAAGRRPSPVAGDHAGRPPRNKGIRYPADPLTIEEIVAVMRTAGGGAHGRRLHGLIVVLWRAGLRIHEALALGEPDLDHRAARCLSGTARAAADARSAWTSGRENNSSHGSVSGSDSRRSAVSIINGHARPAVVERGRPRGSFAGHHARWRASALRAAPAPARARRRDGTRRRPADRHPTPARPPQPAHARRAPMIRHHIDLSPRHRQRGDHRHSLPKNSNVAAVDRFVVDAYRSAWDAGLHAP
ncbi:MAG: hypothetical protein ACR2L8_07295 [Solirubrobacteraceae bacterium]